jgi:hypothetical protein
VHTKVAREGLAIFASQPQLALFRLRFQPELNQAADHIRSTTGIRTGSPAATICFEGE